MADNVIQVENLSKRYLLSHEGASQGGRFKYRRFSDALVSAVSAPLRALKNSPAPDSEEFWALKDVSFGVNRGDVIGVIGRNGAGKSTLLKILSRIVDPTEGRVEIEGRVASLLEVGTGFHPELSGRENIYLNGAILGMTRTEIKKKFDEIVAFAEVDKFLDTQVKHFSSGMYVRLAFSVAAHLEPEILIVDEVLAVGDIQFQQKCLGKMHEVSSNEGRTVLFVSHNLTAIQTLCGKAIYLKSGRIAGVGPVETQIAEYLKEAHGKGRSEDRGPVQLGAGLELIQFKFNPNPVVSGHAVEFTLELSSSVDLRLNEMAILIFSSLVQRVAILDLRPHGVANLPLPSSRLTLRGTIRSLPLVEGDYQAGLFLGTDTVQDNFLELAPLHVIASPNNSHVAYPAVHRGVVELDFSLEPVIEKKNS